MLAAEFVPDIVPMVDFDYRQGDLIVFKKDPEAGVFIARNVIVGSVWPSDSDQPVSAWMTNAFRQVSDNYSESWINEANVYRKATQADVAAVVNRQLDPPAGTVKPETSPTVTTPTVVTHTNAAPFPTKKKLGTGVIVGLVAGVSVLVGGMFYIVTNRKR